MKRSSLCAALISTVILLAISPPARAATPSDVFWKPTGVSTSWDTTSTNWSTDQATSNYIWTSSGSERANFTLGTAGTVTIAAGGVSAYGVNFGIANYVIAGAPLTLAGTGGPIFNNVTATISAPIGGSVGLTKTGSGVLNLTAANTYTGGTTVFNGTVVGTAQSSGGSPFSSGPITLNMGTLNLKGIGTSTTTTVGDLTVAAPSLAGSGTSTLTVDNTAGGALSTTTFAAGNLVRGGVGSVLLVVPTSGNLATGTSGEAVTFTGGTALTNGILPAWVVTQVSGATNFSTYGANGLATLTTYSPNDLTTSSNTDVVNQTTVPTISGDVSAYALKTNQAINLAGNTLNLGNGSGQSGLVLNSGGSITGGNINFGNTEGVVYVQGTTTLGTVGNTITSNGLTITATGASNTTLNGNIVDGSQPAQLTISNPTANSTLTIAGTNNYTGGTFLDINTGTSSTSIAIASDSPFGSGKIVSSVVLGTNSPQISASGADREITNPMDLNGGLALIGTNSLTFSGAINIIVGQGSAGTSRTFLNQIATVGKSVTFGSGFSPSTITLGNPVANGGDGIGRTLLFAPMASTTMIINDVMQDPAAGGGAASGSVTYGSGATLGVVQINSQSTYTGPTNFNGPTNSMVQFSTDSSPDGTAGPFGAGTLVFTNSANNFLQPIAGNRTISNPMSLVSGFTVNSATGDTTSGVAFTGPIALTNAGRTITNSLAPTATMTLGSTGSPSTITMSNVAGQTLTFGGAGTTVINDTIQDLTGFVDNISVTATGSTTFNGPVNSNGTVTLSGAASTVTINRLRTGTGNTSLTGQAMNVLIGVSSNALPAAGFTSGPFGNGTVTVNNTTAPPILQAFGGDRSVSNAITLSSGLFVASAATPFNLTLAGPVTLGTTSRTLTNNTVAGGKSLIFGDSSAPSTISLGATLSIQTQASGGGSTIINDVIQNNGANTGSLTVQNNALVQATAANTYTGTTTVSSGSLTFTKPYTSGATVNVSGGKLTMASSLATPNEVTLKTNALTVSGTGKLDLVDNKLVVHGGALGTASAGTYNGITGLIQTGRAGSAWTGNGIITSAPTVILGAELKTIGVALNSDLINPKTTFGGVPVATNDVLAMYTYTGDANLDGRVNADDYFQIDSHYNNSGTTYGYENGDFNYDGVINGDDYFLIDQAFAGQGAQIPNAPPVAGITAVPEPASVGLIGFALSGLMLGRRRR